MARMERHYLWIQGPGSSTSQWFRNSEHWQKEAGNRESSQQVPRSAFVLKGEGARRRELLLPMQDILILSSTVHFKVSKPLVRFVYTFSATALASLSTTCALETVSPIPIDSESASLSLSNVRQEYSIAI